MIPLPGIFASAWRAPQIHRYWRVRIYENLSYNNTAACSADEIELRGSIGGADLTGSGTAAASSELSATYAAADAFNNATGVSNSWVTANSAGGTHWISYDFGEGNEVDIVEISWAKRPDSFGAHEAMIKADVQYSDDNSNWTTAWQIMTQPTWSGGAETRVFQKYTEYTISLPHQTTYSYTGADQDFTIPSGVTTVEYALGGGGGAAGKYFANRNGGAGGYTKGTLSVSPGDVLRFQVGQGGRGAPDSNNGGAGGWPDGGSGSNGDTDAGGGGGSTRLWKSTDSGSTWTLIAVAGGGGGSAGYSGSAGAGGGLEGQWASNTSGAYGGSTQFSTVGADRNDALNTNKQGVAMSTTNPAATRTGGWGSSTGDVSTLTSDDGGGGGGGFYGGGGGGGDGQAGAGGSGYVNGTGSTHTGDRVTPPSEMTTNPNYPGSNASYGRTGTNVYNDHGYDGWAALYY